MESFTAGMSSFARNHLRLDGLSSDPNNNSSSSFPPTLPVPVPWRRNKPNTRRDAQPATATSTATDGPTAPSSSLAAGGGVGDQGMGFDDDSWPTVLLSAARVVACFLTMMVTTFAWAVLMLFLLPWPYARVRQGNLYGHVTGKLMMWILGNPVVIEGSEFSNKRGIYICNHASPLDIFLVMWLTPTGTVGIAKKEIIWYPLFGQLYVLANHLRIDRSNPGAAIKSIKEAVNSIVRNNLSLIIFPEGTRSKTGRLLPFKKGFVHMALQSRLPIIPMVITGTHKAWRKGSLRVRPAPLTVKYIHPISTDEWKEENINEYVEMIHQLYVEQLPEAQRPKTT